ncbi:MAG TPA: DUF2141 domain-containing protein [Caulobacteraceae bacterium]|nr:DUF2141 domain-containing protein [Caulobacteraceae bacterium]
MKTFIASLTLAAGLACAGAASAGDLVVELTGVEARPGKLFVTLDTKDTFFRQGGRLQQVDPKAGTVKVVYKDLPAGEYSFMLFHDENQDGKMAMSPTGMPAEGWALSNADKLMGPPTFEVMKFTVPAEGTTVVVPVIYSAAP